MLHLLMVAQMAVLIIRTLLQQIREMVVALFTISHLGQVSMLQKENLNRSIDSNRCNWLAEFDGLH